MANLEKIVAAAAKVFKTGYHAATVQDIAGRALLLRQDYYDRRSASTGSFAISTSTWLRALHTSATS